LSQFRFGHELVQRAFIKRIPGQARAIQLIIRPDHIPKLECPFEF
jgi:hypothetical protein